MISGLTLRYRIFFITSILIFVSFALIWIFVRPRYKAQIIKERSTIVSQLQEYSLKQTEVNLRNWLNATNYVAEEIIQRPGEVESLVRRTIGLTPRLMRIQLTDTQTGQEIDVNRSIYDGFTYPELRDGWEAASIDPRISLKWIPDTTQTVDYFITQRPIQLDQTILVLTLYFDAEVVTRDLTNLLIDGDYEVAIFNNGGVPIFEDTPLSLSSDLLTEGTFSNQETMEFAGMNWFILNSQFETIPYWHVVGIEESVILEPVNNLIIYSLFTSAGILFVMLIFSNYVSLKINKPIATLIGEVESMSNLDFEKQINKPSLPEFSLMQETLENIRLTLLRYQKLNVEKIILEEWKNRYMMTYSEDLIGIMDVDGRFNFTNNQMLGFLESLKLDPKQVTMEGILKHPDLSKTSQNQMIHYPEPFTVKIEQSELKHFINEENVSYYEAQLLTIIDEEKVEQGSLFILHNTTEERLLDQKRNQMINIIVHELKNPVTGVVGLSSLLIENPEIDPDEQKILMKEILISGQRMNELVNRFLDVQRLESGRVEIDKKPVDLLEIATNVRHVSKATLDSKSLALRILFNDQMKFTVMGSGDLIFDAVQNLVSNAIKYGDPERVIDLELGKTDEGISLSCIDYGYGIGMEDQQKVFDKFFRVKSNPKLAREKGSGLGLAYVKEIMVRHNGDVTLESNKDIGCKFTLIFPEIVEKELEIS